MEERLVQLVDIKKVCKDCEQIFVFSIKDQEFFNKMVKEKKWEIYKQPERCIPCRRLRQRNRV